MKFKTLIIIILLYGHIIVNKYYIHMYIELYIPYIASKNPSDMSKADNSALYLTALPT